MENSEKKKYIETGKKPYEKPVVIEIDLEEYTDGKAYKVTEAGLGQGPS